MCFSVFGPFRHCIDLYDPGKEAVFILNMLKTNAAAWRLLSVLDSALWGRSGNVHAVKTPCKSCIWSRRLHSVS